MNPEKFFIFLNRKAGRFIPKIAKVIYFPEEFQNQKWFDNLEIHNLECKEIPKGLNVRGFMNIIHTSVQTLPPDLIVLSDLYLPFDFPLENIPRTIQVGGKLYRRTQLNKRKFLNSI